jgi:hypothetical protein
MARDLLQTNAAGTLFSFTAKLKAAIGVAEKLSELTFEKLQLLRLPA